VTSVFVKTPGIDPVEPVAESDVDGGSRFDAGT